MKTGRKNEVMCLGEALVDLVSLEPGKAIKDTRDWRLTPGGAVCNVAVGLARLGLKVGLITKVGSDPFGRMMLYFLKQEGVDTEWIKTTDSDLTALVFVALDKKRKPRFFFYGTPGADRGLSSEEIGNQAFQKIKVFHFGTISLSVEPVRSATLRAIKMAQQAGALLSFDPNLRFHLWKDHRALKKIAWSLIPKVDLIKLNQDELNFLTGGKDLKKGAEMLVKSGAKIVVVTLGRKGAFFATEKYQGTVPAFKFKPVDTTGAGDAFAAAMIYSLTQFPELPPEEKRMTGAVRFANAFAGLSTLELGAISGLKRPRQIERFLQAHPA